MKRKILLVLCLSLAMMFVFAACGGDTPPEPTPTVEPTEVTLSQTTAAMLIGGAQLTLTASVKYSDNTVNDKVIWKTSDASVVTVENGVVTAVGLGTASVTAAAEDKESVAKSCAIEVIDKASLTLNASETTLIMNKGTARIIATVKHSNGAIDSNVTWTTSKPTVATIATDGTITPIAVGATDFTATVVDGSETLTAICKVNVVQDATGLTNGTKNGLTFTVRNTDSNDKLGYSVKAANKDITEAAIPDAYNGLRVNEIEAEAFRQCTKLTKFELGKSVVKIGARAFKMETEVKNEDGSLKEIDHKVLVSGKLKADLKLNAGTELEEYGFEDSFFKTIIIPEGVTVIPAYAFSGSTTTKVVFPTTLTEIKGYAFAGCKYLATADLTPTKVTVIGSKGSDGMSLGNSFFQCGVLTTVGTMPSTLKTIEAYTFSICTNLTDIKLNDGLEKLGAQSFMQCSKIAEISIPATVVKVGENVFGKWGSDQKINVGKKSTELTGWNAAWAGRTCEAVISYKA